MKRIERLSVEPKPKAHLFVYAHTHTRTLDGVAKQVIVPRIVEKGIQRKEQGRLKRNLRAIADVDWNKRVMQKSIACVCMTSRISRIFFIVFILIICKLCHMFLLLYATSTNNSEIYHSSSLLCVCIVIGLMAKNTAIM